MPTTNETLIETIDSIADRAREASLQLATLESDAKDRALAAIATGLREATGTILEENAIDLKAGEEAGLPASLMDRLRLTPERIEKMAAGIDAVIALPDPVGETIETLSPPNGLDIRKIRVPIGVIGIIYESRPNVTIDCAVLCLKSGNASILRGGKEAIHSNRVLGQVIRRALGSTGVSPDAVQLIPTTDRAALNALLKLNDRIHCIIPRGGEGLIRFVAENSTIPVIKHFTGVCNAFVAADANLETAVSVVVNAKTQRPGVCNAIENLLIEHDGAQSLFPPIARALSDKGVCLRVDPFLAAVLDPHGIAHEAATEEDWGTEYLDLNLSARMVESVDEAIGFINRYGSGHSDTILTTNESTALRFLNGVDGATVYWNASTRFTDGFEFGLGAEIGISTDRLHARGPMGLRELCSYKFQIFGKGEIRN